MKDDQCGYVLDVIDLANDKLMAAVSRREPRDAVLNIGFVALFLWLLRAIGKTQH